MKTLTTYFLTALLMLSIFSCSSDEPKPIDEQEGTVNIEDPKAISENLTFGNGSTTAVKGELPKASTDTGAPQLAATDGKNRSGISGGKIALELNTTTASNIKGVYFKVNDADEYYDILLNDANANGRIFIEHAHLRSQRVLEGNALLISLPAGLTSGVFCATYAVYDDENRVSNAIEICVEVKSNGGENSNFLTANEWALEKEYYAETIGHEITYEDIIIPGENEIYESETTLPDCPDQNYTIQQVSRLNHMYAVFSADGTFNIEINEYEKYVNYDASNCNSGIVYHIEDPYIETSDGTWAYDHSTEKLTLDRVYYYQEEGTNLTDRVIEVYTVTQEGGKLILSNEEIDGSEKETYTMTFSPKN